MPDEGYYTAQVCQANGHVSTSALEFLPSSATPFCQKCGAPTISACLQCGSAIRGSSRNSYTLSNYQPPAYCLACGTAFPWTAERLSALRDLIGMSKASEAEQAEILKDLDAIATDTPRTQIVAMRLKKFLARAGDEAVPAARQILIQVASAAAKAGLGL